MAHYAFLDENNIVTEVIVGKNENEQGPEGPRDWEQHYGNFRGQTCKRTSYNTHNGVHLLGGTPFRKNFAGAGFTYDAARDAFIRPQPYPSWTFNETTCDWDPPVPYPEGDVLYGWNEDTQTWDIIE